MKQTIKDILEIFRAEASNNRDLGDKFERLIAAYLTKDPYYANHFSNVWLWTEWPGRNNKPDIGIDLVAQERGTGDFTAIGLAKLCLLLSANSPAKGWRRDNPAFKKAKRHCCSRPSATQKETCQ